MKHNRMRFTRCKYLRRWPLDILHRNSRENGRGSFCVANLTSSVRAVFSRREFFLRCSRLNIVLVINFDDTSSLMFVLAAIANLFRIYVDVNSCVLFVRIKIRGQRSRNRYVSKLRG